VYDFFAGCDTHKAEHSICIINPHGKTLESFSIENNLQGWSKVLKTFQKYPNILCGIENHANYAKLFSKFLVNNNIALKEVNPVYTGQRRKASTKRDKTDQIDSLVVAKITRDEQNQLPDICFDDRQEQVKLISKYRDDLVEEKVRLVNRMHSKLIQVDTSYKKNYGRDLSEVKVLKKLEKDFSKYNDIRSLLILRDIKRLKSIVDEITEIEQMMEEYAKKDSLIANLDSIGGIGTITAFKLVALVGDISKFKKEDKFACYVGASPIRFASGSYSKVMKNRGGQKKLNCLMMQITRTQKRHYAEARKYFEKKLSEGKTESQAMISLKRKLVKIIYRIYKNNEPYNYCKRTPEKVLQAV